MSERLTSGDLVRMIRARHDARAGWCVFEEAPNGTGHHSARFCDVLAMQTWPSRGLSVFGYEVKVDRRDLVRELRDPRKADAFQRWCDQWWVVVPDVSIVDGMVMPETWGVLIVKKGKLAVHRAAPALTPAPWDKTFVAALARSFTDGMVPKRELDEARQQTDATISARVQAELDRERKNDADNAAVALAELQKRVADFEAASGISISKHWAGGGRVGQAVSIVLGLVNNDRRLNAFRHLLTNLDEAVGRLRDLDTAVRDLVTPTDRGAAT